MRNLKQSTIITFWALIGTFVFILGVFFIPAIGDLFRGSIFLLPLIVFSLLGIALIILTLKEKPEGKLKKFLILTGVSAFGFFVFVVLHNAFYALGIITKEIFVLSSLMEVLHVVFFLIAIPVCPIGFLVGAIGSITILIKKNNRNP